MCVCGRGGGLEELFRKNFGQALTAQIRTLDDSGIDYKIGGMEVTFTVREPFEGHGAQTKRGDLHRTPDQPPCGREKEKQRVLVFGGFQGVSVNKLQKREILSTTWKIKGLLNRLLETTPCLPAVGKEARQMPLCQVTVTLRFIL